MTDVGYPICLTCGKLWQEDMNRNQDEVIERLQKELAAIKKDALRYMWLRDTGNETWLSLKRRSVVSYSSYGIDEAIDAAMKAL